MQRRRWRDRAFARLTDGRTPRDEADIANVYDLARQWARVSDTCWYNEEDWGDVKRAAVEFIRLVDQERAERDHREPGPLAQ